MSAYDRVFVAEWGGEERRFRLRNAQIFELERLCGDIGIYAIARKLVSGDGHFAYVREVVRLGLIGEGETAKRASELVGLYIDDGSPTEAFPVAVGILRTTLDPPKTLKKKPDGGNPEPTPSPSTPASSTEQGRS